MVPSSARDIADVTHDPVAPTAGTPARPHTGAARAWIACLPIGLLAIAAVAAWALGAIDLISLETLDRHHAALLDQVDQRPVAVAAAYLAIYAASTAAGLPIAVFLTVTGGFLFGTVLGGAYAVVGATAGATVMFLAARTGLRDPLVRLVGSRMGPLERGMREDALSYLLVLRLLPVVPFWLVNLVPGLLGVRLRPFLLATTLGIVPGCLVYASVGSGLAFVSDGGPPDASVLYAPQVLGPLVALAALSLLPVAYKRLRRRGRR